MGFIWDTHPQKEGTNLFDGTRKFAITDDSDKEMKRILTAVYDALG